MKSIIGTLIGVGVLLSVSAQADTYACRRAAKFAAVSTQTQQVHNSAACEADLVQSAQENIQYQVAVYCGQAGFASFSINTKPILDRSGNVAACDVLNVAPVAGAQRSARPRN